MYDYIANCNMSGAVHAHPVDTWCMMIQAKAFLAISLQFPEFSSYMLIRGMQRRAFLKAT